MGCVKVLDDATISQIAAGEVIDRPASAVKELVENAVDAGAGRVEIEIRNGGRSLIRVTDDGIGMDQEDLRLSVERHATSKIGQAGDLLRLATLGFRGEALPSIAAAAGGMEIASRLRGRESGFVLEIKAGSFKRIRPAGLPEGTTVRVSDLFANLPARLKYLKSIPTEAGYVADVVGRLAVAYPGISFHLVHHEYEILFTPGSGDHMDAIGAVFGRDMAREMLPIEETSGEGVTVTGFIGKPSIAKTTRHYEMFFVNGRFIRSRTAAAAVEKAFQSILPIARYPLAIIFMAIDPALVDVNAHPTKIEARFADEAAVFRAVHTAVKRSLSAGSAFFAWRESKAAPKGHPAASPAPAPETRDRAPAAATQPLPLAAETTGAARARITSLGAALNATYLLAKDDEGFLLIDQHAAHERVLFDRYLARGADELGPQGLLLPATLHLSFQQDRTLAERMPLFLDLGFDLERFGPNTYILRAVPAALSRLDGARLVLDLLDELIQGPAPREAEAVRRAMTASLACHAAVKAGDVLSPREMQALLEDLAATETPFTCPHGRPTAIRLGWDEIARRFRRR